MPYRRAPRAVAALALLVAVIAAVLVLAPRSHHNHHDSTAAKPRSRHEAAATRSHVRMVSGARARRRAVPILMYHVLGTPPPGAPYPQLWVSAHAFASQVHMLALAGYHGVTLRQV